jgi:tRNA pseudouridine13 synthase
MKDRLAVTRQWFSVRRLGGTPADWTALDVDGVKILATSRNTRKLRRGAHAGNQFQIVLRNLVTIAEEADENALDQRVRAICEQGVPNYFGEQRFGREAGNLQLAEVFFAGKRLKRDKRSIALSSARAWIFNQVLQQRVQDGSWSKLRPGDTAILDGSGSIFPVEDVDDELLQRCKRLDLHPSGPLWGEGGNPQPREQEIAGGFVALAAGLEKNTKSSRRSLRLAVRNLTASPVDDAQTLDFYLARGGFATAVLRELVNYG